MLEVILENGEPHNLNDLKGYLKNFGRDYLLADMADGNFPLFLQHNNHRDYLRLIFDHAEKQKQNLSLEEKRWLNQLGEMHNNLDDFIMNYFTSTDKDEKLKYMTKYGVSIANMFDTLIEGYKNETNPKCPACPKHNKDATWESWKKEINSLSYFVRESKRIYAKDEYGIKIPIDLNVVD